MKYEEFLERWNNILLKLSWVIIPGSLFILVVFFVIPIAWHILRM